LLPIINSVVLAEEGITEDEEWSLGGWNVKSHESNRAPIITLVHIILGLQVQDVSTNNEAEVWQLLVV